MEISLLRTGAAALSSCTRTAGFVDGENGERHLQVGMPVDVLRLIAAQRSS